jgi:hypothetical protein
MFRRNFQGQTPRKQFCTDLSTPVATYGVATFTNLPTKHGWKLPASTQLRATWHTDSIGSPTIYRCFALPQLLYRWWHHSGIFWIPLRTINWCCMWHASVRTSMHTRYVRVVGKEREHLEITINFMIILKWSFRECTGKGVECIHVAHIHIDHCLVLGNIVMTLRVGNK